MMGIMPKKLMLITTMVLLTSQLWLPRTRSYHVGVNYGLNGNNLASPQDVISLYKKCQIEFIRLFEPYHLVLEALRGSNLLVALGTTNADLQILGTSQEAANAWVNTNIVPYKDDVNFGWITLGNEAIPGQFTTFIPQAMNNMYNALISLDLPVTPNVSTVVPMNVLATSYPPSAGAFSIEVVDVMKGVATFLLKTGGPLLVNVYPYFPYSSDPVDISSDYAAFNPHPSNIVVDGPYCYDNLFDAMVDAVHAALEKIDAANVTIDISETGWPSAGNDPYTSKDYAQIYNQNLVTHVLRNGTPRRPDRLMATFLFAMFNENLKPAGTEQNFGLFYPNMQPVYPFFTNCVPQ